MTNLRRLRYLFVTIMAILMVMAANRFPRSSSLEDYTLDLMQVATGISERKAPSNVVIVEIDDRTWQNLGWPLRHEFLTLFLQVLIERGHPPVVLTNQIQNLSGERNTQSTDEHTLETRRELIQQIKSYGKFIGSSLQILMGNELTSEQELNLLPLALVSNRDLDFTNLPYLPLALLDSPDYQYSYRAIGLGPSFNIHDRMECMRLYVDTVENPGEYVIPSSLLQGVASWLPHKIVLENGAALGNKESPQILFLSKFYCLQNPEQTTPEYFQEQNIPVYSFLDIVERTIQPDLSEKLLVLASSESRTVLDVGSEASVSSTYSRINEHLLFARFLNTLTTNSGIKKEDTLHHVGLDMAVMIFLCLSAILGYRNLVWGICSGIMGIVTVSVYFGIILLGDKIPSLPGFVYTSILASVVVNVLFFAVTKSIVIYYREQIREQLRIGLATAISLDHLQQVVRSAVHRLLPGHSLKFINNTDDIIDETSSTDEINPRGVVSQLQSKSGMTCRIHFSNGHTWLGDIQIAGKLKAWEQAWQSMIIEQINASVSLHWNRISVARSTHRREIERTRLKSDLEMGRIVQDLLVDSARQDDTPLGRYEVIYKPHGPMSGDWFHCYKSDNFLILAIGDVVGKGPSAALATGVIATIWHAEKKFWQKSTATPDLDRLFANLNRSLFALFKGQQNTTLSLALIASHKVHLYRCGAPTWLLLNNKNEIVKSHKGPSQVLGLKSELVVLPPLVLDRKTTDCSTVLGFTDGVMDGTMGIQQFIKRIALYESPVTRDEIIAESSNIEVAHQDDATLLRIDLT